MMNQTWTNIRYKCLNIEENEPGVECVMFTLQGELTSCLPHHLTIVFGEIYQLVSAKKLLLSDVYYIEFLIVVLLK